VLVQQIVVELFADDESEWWWEARQLRLRRGPFTRQREADEDAVEHAEALISALCSTDNAA
jgi:hypothetical protein